MQDIQDSSSARLSGRPKSIEPDRVARIALELFSTHGYAEVSMEQISQAAGIGRKSLYRYFASKADLVWGGLLEASAISEAALAQSEATERDLLQSMHAATMAAFDSLPNPEVTRSRLRLIAAQPELLAQASVRMAPDNERILRHFSAAGVAAESVKYLALAFGSVTFAAWIRWAQSSDSSPASHLANALKVLRLPR